MRKVFCLLIILVILNPASVCADQHMEVSCTVRGLSNDRDETADLYEQEGKIIAVSTLFPEYAVEIKKETTDGLSFFHTLCSLTPDMFGENKKTFERLIRSWIEQHLSDPVYGIYSGELFNEASVIQHAQFPLSKMAEYLRNSTIEGIPSGNCIISLISEYIRLFFGEKELLLSLRCYDNWRYISVNISENDNVIMTISADLAAEEEHYLIGYREEGNNVFRRITISEAEKNVTIISSYWSGKESSYLNVSHQNPLFTEKFVLSNWLKIYELDADSLSEPLIISGISSAEEDGQANMDIQVSINKHEQELISISINFEPLIREVSFSDKKSILPSDEKEYTLFSLAVAANIQELVAEIIPSIPIDYQRMLLTLLYP